MNRGTEIGCYKEFHKIQFFLVWIQIFTMSFFTDVCFVIFDQTSGKFPTE